MTERAGLEAKQLMLHGHCCIEYKDDITGKVREKIEGNNHVFVDQFAGATSLYNYFNQPILLCEGGSDISDALPIIPGNPIGIGMPGQETYGIYRGAWRSSDAYILHTNGNTGVSSKHVYDFTAQQAIGSLKWLGLNIMAYTVPKSILYPGISYSNLTNRILDSKTGWAFYVYTTPTFQTEGNIVCRNMLTGANTTIPISLSTLGITEYYNTSSSSYNSLYTRLVYDNVNERLHAIISYYKSQGARTAIWATFNDAFTAVESTEDMDWLKDWTGYDLRRYNGVLNNNKILFLSSPVWAEQYTEHIIDLVEHTYTSNDIGIAVELQNCNLFYFDQNIDICENYVWWAIPYNRYYDSSYGYMSASSNSGKFRTISPVYQLDTMSVVSYTPPLSSFVDSSYPKTLKNSIGVAPNQLIVGMVDTTNKLSGIIGALTKYKIPDGAPDRPEGSAMSITYDIELEW